MEVEEAAREAFGLFRSGMCPSDIDRLLRYRKGTARILVRRAWAMRMDCEGEECSTSGSDSTLENQT